MTLRGLMGRRRLVADAAARRHPGPARRCSSELGGGRADVERDLDGLVVRIVLPLVALVFGTAALGSELEDGTAVHLLTKPIRRWPIVARQDRRCRR